MTRIKRVSAVFLALFLIPIFSGCGSNSAKQAERSITALSTAQSADSLHATIETAVQEEASEPEIQNTIEYWKAGDNILSVTTLADSDGYATGGKLWFLYYDGGYYEQATFEHPDENAEVSGYPWTARDTNDGFDPNLYAFWQKLEVAADDLTFVSMETDGDSDILTFQMELPADTQVNESMTFEMESFVDEPQVDGILLLFNLAEDDSLQELTVRATITVDAGSTQGQATLSSHAIFEDTDATSIQKTIEVEAQNIT